MLGIFSCILLSYQINLVAFLTIKIGEGAQWLSAWLETEGPRVRASPASLRCVLEQEH